MQWNTRLSTLWLDAMFVSMLTPPTCARMTSSRLLEAFEDIPDPTVTWGLQIQREVLL